MIAYKRFFLCFAALMLTLMLISADCAATERKTLQDEIPKDIVNSDKDKFFTVVFENDSIGAKNTDDNYTNGVRFTYFDLNADIPDFVKSIASYIPTFEMNETTSVFYSFGQNLYTPSDISQRRLDPDDRPWATHLYGSAALVTVTDNHLDEIEISLGLIGPSALGEQTQKFVHSHVTPSSQNPKGWNNQLDHEPTIGVGWNRRFPQAMQMDLQDYALDVSPYYGATLGNAYTYANAGFNVRLTPESEKWQDAPVRVKPALPGTGFFEIPENDWSWYLFSGLETRAVARNIFLDGNSFKSSHSVEKKPFVVDLNAGLALTYDVYRLSYTMVYRSKEFKGQDDSSVFGAISIGYRF